MWVRISIKPFIAVCLLGLCFGFLFAQGLSAFPQFTSRENAIRLADVLDKGHFRGSQITSVFVKNQGEEEYYLQAILDEGSSRRWTMDSIHDWAKKDDLLLAGNRALIFPVPGSTEFDVLEKNSFYRTVLKASVFNKTYGPHDPLEGRSLLLSIRKFGMLDSADEDEYSIDETGHRYRYVLELENGTREFLTYPEAYRLFKSGTFIRKPDPEAVVHRSPFQVRELKKVERRLEDELRNIWSFGVEVFFDRPVTLKPSQIGYQVVEQYLRNPLTGKKSNQFFIHVIFPNTLKNREIPGFEILEYLRFVQVVSDVEHQRRVILRAQVKPEALELPPFMEVTDRNSVIVYFFTVTDQSIASLQDYLQTKVHLPMPRTLISAEGPRTAFEKEYLKAVELISSAQRQETDHLKVEDYLGALEALHNASLQAENDVQISHSLKQRDVLLKVLPKQVIQNCQATLLSLKKSGKQPDEELRQQLLRQLGKAKLHARTEEQKKKIESLRNLLQ